MSKLKWNEAGSRTFEVGVDRGVLYPDSTFGVAWSGLTAVSEKSSGGEPTSYYLDGKKLQTVTAATEYAATIEAFSAPSEFDRCDGIVALSPGLFQTHQKRHPFGFSYRTKLGNDVFGQNRDYKIHIVYNATAHPSNRSYSTRNDSPEAMSLSWEISTVGRIFAGMNPTAHIVISSRKYNAYLMKLVEAVLYGDDGGPARLPEPSEIQTLLQSATPGYGHGAYGHIPYGV